MNKTKISRVLRMNAERAAYFGVENELTAADWESVLCESGGSCFYCGVTVGENLLTLDHKIPICKKGRHCKANIVAACFPCNRKKGRRINFTPNTLPFLVKTDELLTKTELADRLLIPFNALNDTLKLYRIQPAGICSANHTRNLYAVKNIGIIRGHLGVK